MTMVGPLELFETVSPFLVRRRWRKKKGWRWRVRKTQWAQRRMFPTPSLMKDPQVSKLALTWPHLTPRSRTAPTHRWPLRRSPSHLHHHHHRWSRRTRAPYSRTQTWEEVKVLAPSLFHDRNMSLVFLSGFPVKHLNMLNIIQLNK